MNEINSSKNIQQSGVQGSVLVAGAGISGIQSSLDLADAGFKVYLVDSGLSIGGIMTKLDKTFPTNDCSMCILAPKLVYTGRHRNITIMTNTEIAGIKGEVGNFEVTLKKNPRFINQELCNGCGDCVQYCPVKILSDYDEGLGFRKAIYQPFAQAIPNIFAIEKSVGRAPCKVTCPAGLNAQGFIALTSQQKFAEAFTLIKETIPLPGSLGRICYHTCEAECNRKEIDEPVSICKIRRFVADYIYNNPEKLAEYQKSLAQSQTAPGKEKKQVNRGRGRKVAIIGSGPSGLTAAADLARMGYAPTIFEAEKNCGGMLYYGVPSYRLPKEFLDFEIKRLLEEHRIEVHNGQRLGKNFCIDDLRKKGFETTYIAIGTWKSKESDITGETEKRVIHGIDFLHRIAEGTIGEAYFKGRKIAVVGGGNVAMDCARSAKRLGAEVTVVYRRTFKEIPAHKDEISGAQEEGIVFDLLTIPLSLASKQGKTFLTCKKMKLGEPDASGRRKPVPVEGSEFDKPCDMVIFAIGQELDLTVMQGSSCELTKSNLINADPVTLQTTQKDVFAGGDAVSGPASAVEAIAAGHQAALSIDRFLNGEDLKEGRTALDRDKAPAPRSASRIQKARNKNQKIPVQQRTATFGEIESAFSMEEAVDEAQRCINCGGCCECMQCVEHCQKLAIDHAMKEERETVTVGAVILSPGFDKYSPPYNDSLGYGIYPNVITSLEFERMLSASGPYKGHVEKVSDGTKPKKIAWLQCVGSRDESCNHAYCSSVCCMYAIKEAVIAKEHQPGVETHIYFMDIRSFGKDFDKYYERAKNEYGVVFRRSRIPQIEQDALSKNLTIKYVDEDGKVRTDTYDMLVLSVGLQPCKTLGDLSATLQINLNEYGFVQTDPFSQVITSRPGIYASGTVTEPKDIPESVTQASAAASEASKDIFAARGSLVTEKEYPAEIAVTNDPPRVGVFVCHCGINIGSIVDVKKVVEYAKTLPYVICTDEATFTCSQDSQEKIKEKIKELNLNRIVIASCTPRTHEPLFQDTLRESGLNPHLFEMVNLRDQNSWVHRDSPDLATRKAMDSVRMGAAKAALLSPVQHYRIPVTNSALVIGGGIAGMNAALSIADQDYKVYLLEKEHELGGHLKEIFLGIRQENPQQLLVETIDKVKSHKNIELYTEAVIEEITGYVGNFITKIKAAGTTHSLQHGVVVVATGAEPYEPTEYSYGTSPNILKQKELEKDLFENTAYLKELKEVVMIQCVGSRNDEHPYCSRICCANALKNAIKIKDINPAAAVYVLYRDIRAYGFREDRLYSEARKRGVIFIRFEKEKEPSVEVSNGEIQVRVFDAILGDEILFHPDRLVLSTGIVPFKNITLSQQLKVPLNADGFYSEAHMKLRPVEFAVDGIYLCGTAHSPRFIEETILQAKAAASRAATTLSKKHLETIGNVAFVNTRNCAGCQLCIAVCPYEAIRYDEHKRSVVINEILCQGCGSCSAICPSGTSQQNTFTKKQILAMIDSYFV